MAERAFTTGTTYESEATNGSLATESMKRGQERFGQKHAFGRSKHMLNLNFRFLAFALTLAAFILMILAKQTVSIPVQLGVVVYDVKAVAEWQYDTTFVFFLIANAIVCLYAFSMFMFSAMWHLKRVYPTVIAFTFIICDLAMSYFLLSACSATTSTAIIGKYGNNHSLWAPICDKFSQFCQQVGIALIISYLGFVSLAILAVLNTYQLYRMHAS